MFTSSRGSSIRPLGFVTLALALAVLGLQVPVAFAMDRARVEQDAERGDPSPDSGRQDRRRQGRGPEGQLRPPMGPQQGPRFQPQQAPQPGAVFAPSPRAPAMPARGFDYRPRPDRIVPRVPPGYREYRWGGMPYYHHGDRWYRPYGGSFLIVGAPFGLFVPYLPAYYTTFWYGGTRYFLADETYYLYDPVRRGYIVTRSPYGNERAEDDEDGRDAVPSSAELFVYPMRGQSESQQAEDRYQCHRWSADQVHYDPTESEYRATERAEYDRAISACLTGRGYSVK